MAPDMLLAFTQSKIIISTKQLKDLLKYCYMPKSSYFFTCSKNQYLVQQDISCICSEVSVRNVLALWACTMCTKKQLLKLIISFCDPTILFLGSEEKFLFLYIRGYVCTCVYGTKREPNMEEKQLNSEV